MAQQLHIIDWFSARRVSSVVRACMPCLSLSKCCCFHHSSSSSVGYLFTKDVSVSAALPKNKHIQHHTNQYLRLAATARE